MSNKRASLQVEAIEPETSQEVELQVEEQVEAIEPETGAVTPQFDLATVFDGAREVRRYDLETHGEAFAKLAQEFSSNRGYRVEMGFLVGKIECPNCGNKFNL